MYVLVRTDLSKARQAVQGGHALVEYLLHHQQDWNNHTLIYLGVKNEWHLKKWIFMLGKEDIPVAVWREPDMNNEITAIAAYTNNGFFKKLNCI